MKISHSWVFVFCRLVLLTVFADLLQQGDAKDFVPIPGMRQSSMDSCGKLYASLPASGTELGWEEIQRINGVMRAFPTLRTTPEYVKEFVESGWPAITRWAKEKGGSPAELLQQMIDQLMYVEKSLYVKNPDAQKSLQNSLSSMIPAIRWLFVRTPITNMRDIQRLTPKELAAIRSIVDGIRNIASLTMSLEYNLYGSSTVNAALPLTEAQIKHIFHSFEDLGDGSTLVSTLREEMEKRAISKPKAAPSAADLNRQRPPSASEGPIPLHRYLDEEYPLKEGQVYTFHNSHQGDYTIQFEREVVKEADRRHDREFKKLLSTLAHGDGVRSGLKVLPSLGREVVEVKGVMRSHWRLIGCLKGHSVVIKKFMDMPESKAGYARLLSPDLCAE